MSLFGLFHSTLDLCGYFAYIYIYICVCVYTYFYDISIPKHTFILYEPLLFTNIHTWYYT